MRASRSAVSILGTALLLFLGACGGAGDSGSAGAGQGGGSAGASSSGTGATVQVAEVDLGSILVGPEGRTLYLFLQDTGPEGTCYAACETNWPPLTSSVAPEAGDGVNPSLLGTIERTDGSTQVTYAGHPLYYFGGDEAAGDMNGEGIGDVWFVVSPQGKAVRGGKGGDSGYGTGRGYG